MKNKTKPPKKTVVKIKMTRKAVWPAVLIPVGLLYACAWCSAYVTSNLHRTLASEKSPLLNISKLGH